MHGGRHDAKVNGRGIWYAHTAIGDNILLAEETQRNKVAALRTVTRDKYVTPSRLRNLAKERRAFRKFSS